MRCRLQDENGMWFNSRWTEQQWIDSWSIVAKRYANNTAVLGAGLRNEPRPVLSGEKWCWLSLVPLLLVTGVMVLLLLCFGVHRA